MRRRLLWGSLAAPAALNLGVPAASAHVTVCRTSPDLCPAPARLSDERTVTRLASPVSRATVRTRPSMKGRSIARLRFYTEESEPETYLALSQAIGADRRLWVRIRVPGRPNGRTGWVRRSALGAWRTVTTYLRVDRRHLRATLYRHGRRVWRSVIGVGRPGMPTPTGNFWVRTELHNPFGANPIYGPVAFGTADYSVLSDWPGGGVIGIHGTNEPGLLPGRVSHGCIRMPNRAIRQLARLMPVGTPVHVLGANHG
jgi:hypothetical protein